MSTEEQGDWQLITQGVWRLVAQPASVNVGLIVGETGAILIDTGSSPQQGRRLRERAAEIADVTHVVITHNHFDHFYGLPAFADVVSIGHSSLKDDLTNPAFIRRVTHRGLDPSHLIAPSRLINLATIVDLGDVRAEIVHFGPAHTAGDVVVVVPQRQIVFAGDLVESSSPPAFGSTSRIETWPSALDGILGVLSEHTVIVPGHGDPVDRMFVFDQRARISALFGRAAQLIEQGVACEEALAHGEWPFDDDTVSEALPGLYRELGDKGIVPRPQLPLRPLT